MASFLFGAAGFVLTMVALGLFVILRRRAEVDHMMAAQLLGTGGVAILVLLAAATETPPIVDVALLLALFAAFAAVAFVRSASGGGPGNDGRRMKLAFDIFTVFLVSAGALFFLAGTVGLIRFPDALTRLHALTKVDNLGLGLVVLGLLPQANGLFSALKLVSIWLLVQLSGAIVTQLIAGAVRQRGPQRMTISSVFDIGLVVLILGIGASTIAVREAFAAVIAFVVYGLLLAIAWVRLSAVDVALTEAAIGGGMTGMLLLGAVARLRLAKGNDIRPSLPARFAAGILCALVAAGLAIAVLSPPEVIPTLAPMAMENLPQTGLGNPVAGVLFVYRALDTLLEKVVLILALLGVWSLAPDSVWGGIPGLRVYAQPSSTLTFLAQLLPPVGIVVAIYMCWVGAKEPGGAFQGGTILAAMWLLVMIAGLRRVPSINQSWLRLLLVVGPVIFLAIGIAGMVLAKPFLPIHRATPNR